MNKDKFSTTINKLLILLLVPSIGVLVLVYLNYDSNSENLLLGVIPSLLATLITSLLALVIFKLYLKNPGNENNSTLILNKIEAINISIANLNSKKDIKNIIGRLEEIENSLSCENKMFIKSNKPNPTQVFHYYLELENNCLDYLCLCRGNLIVDSGVHPHIESRLKGNNIRNISAVEQINKYKELALRNMEIIGHTSGKLGEISQGALQKIILDVEYGGVFYYIFDSIYEDNIIYIFGATVEQDAMDFGYAYREMESIFDEIKGII